MVGRLFPIIIWVNDSFLPIGIVGTNFIVWIEIEIDVWIELERFDIFG